jgi:hypothetical protein
MACLLKRQSFSTRERTPSQSTTGGDQQPAAAAAATGVASMFTGSDVGTLTDMQPLTALALPCKPVRHMSLTPSLLHAALLLYCTPCTGSAGV